MNYGLVPKTTEAETKIFYNLSLSRVFGMMVTFVAASNLSSVFVHKYFQPFVFIFALVFYFLFTSKDVNNPKKKFYQGFVSYFDNFLKAKNYRSILGAAYKDERERSTI